MSEAVEADPDKAKRTPEDAAGLKLFATLAASYTVSHAGRGKPSEVRACRTRSIALDRVVVEAAETLAVGTPLYLNIAGLGVCSGRVSRQLENGFVVDIDVTPAQVAKLAPKLRWLKRYYAKDARDTRKHGRQLVPPQVVAVVRKDGPPLAATLYDISSSGLAVRSPENPPVIGTPVTIGPIAATVVRHFSGGFAVQFDESQDIALLKAQLFPKR